MGKVIDLKEKEVREFLDQDVIDLKFFPLEEVRKKYTRSHKVDFTLIHTEQSKKEFKDILVHVFCYGKPYSLKSQKLNYALHLYLLIADIKGLTSIPFDEIEPRVKALGKGDYFSKELIKAAKGCQEFLYELYDTRKGFDRDFWDESIYCVTEERLNKANAKTSFNFRKNIKNVENRELVKLYIKHLIGNTEFSISTILGIFSILSIYCKFLDNVNILDTTKEQFQIFMKQHDTLSDDTFNKYINWINNAYQYFAIKKILKIPNPVDLHLSKNNERKTRNTSVSEHVILQIFNNLHKAPDDYKLIYLINYSTGMRISDVCQLQTNCLYEDGEDGYYIRPYRCQKMRNTIMNLIPKALYELIETHIKKLNVLYPDGIYLFPSEKDYKRPYIAQTYRNNFKDLCVKWDIRNEDGSLYNYKTHDYRHTISTDLYQNYNVPIVTIQKAVLWHQEIQMSLSYVERPDSFRKMQEDRYISKVGESSLPDDIKESLKSHVLPNGICVMSDKFGVCPAVDACLSCPNFRTSKEFLHVHRQQLSTLQSKLVIFEANNWENNIVTARRQIKELEDIIKKLEEMEEDENASTKN